MSAGRHRATVRPNRLRRFVRDVWQGLRSVFVIIADGPVVIVALIVVLGAGAAIAMADAADRRDKDTHRAACQAVTTDLAALQASLDRTSERVEATSAAQVLLNTVARNRDAWPTEVTRWDGWVQTAAGTDDYQRTLVRRITRNLEVCTE